MLKGGGPLWPLVLRSGYMYSNRHFRVTLNKPYKKTTNICELSLANCMDFLFFNFCVKSMCFYDKSTLPKNAQIDFWSKSGYLGLIMKEKTEDYNSIYVHILKVKLKNKL